jgi:hypothetical protein
MKLRRDWCDLVYFNLRQKLCTQYRLVYLQFCLSLSFADFNTEPDIYAIFFHKDFSPEELEKLLEVVLYTG